MSLPMKKIGTQQDRKYKYGIWTFRGGLFSDAPAQREYYDRILSRRPARAQSPISVEDDDSVVITSVEEGIRASDAKRQRLTEEPAPPEITSKVAARLLSQGIRSHRGE